MNGAKQRRGQEYGHGDSLPAGMLQYLPDGQDPLMHPEPSVFLLRFLQLVRTALPSLRPARLFGIIFDKAVILLILYGHVLRMQAYVLQALAAVRQIQIILDQILQKFGRACPVRQDMEHFKINPFLIISHLKQQGLLVADIDPAAGLLVFLPDYRVKIAFFQIMPEQPLSEHRTEQRIGLQGTFQRRFQQIRADLLL